jgi:exo-beta-1,3-glucanase (GH17 family)
MRVDASPPAASHTFWPFCVTATHWPAVGHVTGAAVASNALAPTTKAAHTEAKNLFAITLSYFLAISM